MEKATGKLSSLHSKHLCKPPPPRTLANVPIVPMQQYPQDPNAQHPQHQAYAASPVPQAPHEAYMQPQQPQPGMPPQQPSGTVYKNATPIANLQRGPAPADCPACGQRAMTNTAYETGNTTQ